MIKAYCGSGWKTVKYINLTERLLKGYLRNTNAQQYLYVMRVDMLKLEFIFSNSHAVRIFMNRNNKYKNGSLVFMPRSFLTKTEQTDLKNQNHLMTKKIILLTILTVTTLLGKAQNPANDNYGWNKRISFIVGGGASVVSTKLYADPVVNKTNNFVTIEKASKLKPNLSLGIVYTPFVSNATRTIKVKKDENIVKEKLIEYYPRGISFALFMNPVSISSLSSSSVTNTVDLGLGLGWRSGNFSFFLTNEYFAIRQPRNYFVNQFKNNDQAYVINGDVQNSIDINDNSIFKTSIAVSWGIKFCYTFDIVKSFYSNSKKITADQ